MKVKNSVKILIGLIIVLGISLIYGTSELIFQNIKLNSPQVKENNKTVVMENPTEEDSIVDKPNKDNDLPAINNTEIENNDDDKNEGKNNEIKNNTSNSIIVDGSKIDNKEDIKNNETNNDINNIDNNDDEVTNPEKIENLDTKEDKNNNGKGNNNKNNNNGNKKNNDNKNNKGNDKKDKDKPILENNLISEEKALEIGFKKVGSGGNLENIKAYLDDNPPKYKIEIIKNKQKYKFEIHARTGAILEYEKEKLKNK